MKKNKNLKKYMDANIWVDLIDIIEYTTKDIWDKRYALLPIDLDIDIDYIRSEVYSETGYLINNYRPGDKSLKSYIFEYLQKRVVNNIHKEFKKFHNSYTELIDHQGKRYDNYGNLINDYVENHQIGQYEFESKKSVSKEIEQRDMISDIFNKANKLDKEIMKRYYSGESMQEIADDYGVAVSTIKKRLQRYGK